MPHAAPITVRRATADDLPAMLSVDERGFGFHHTEQGREDAASAIEPARFLVAVEGGRVVGVTGSFGFEVTPPGGEPVPTEGVTWVSVLATHRRRGVLRALFDEQHRGFVADRVPFSVLTASEGGIYGRFGYAPSVPARDVEIDRHRAVPAAGLPDPGGVRYADADEIAERAPDLHTRWCARTPGAVSRDAGWWRRHLRDPEHDRHAMSGMFHLVHADGYATYRVSSDQQTCRVTDFFAVTGEAHLALWRTLLGLDLIEKITTRAVPLDDPLPHLLTDPRQVRTVSCTDGMWARILDVPAALAARRYRVEIDAVLEIADGSLGAPARGRYRLRGGPDGAECGPTDAPVDAWLDVAALGALYFGAARPWTMVEAGRGRIDDEDVLRRLDAALPADRFPRYGTGF